MRPIDADALTKRLEYLWNVNDDSDFANKEVWHAVEEAPTVDVPDRKVGKWECSDDIFEYALCSCCKWDSGEAWEYALKRFRFCPNCGARMKGEDNATVH